MCRRNRNLKLRFNNNPIFRSLKIGENKLEIQLTLTWKITFYQANLREVPKEMKEILKSQ